MRVSEYIHYINQEKEPTKEIKDNYSHISFNDLVVSSRKKYRKGIKGE